MWSDYDAAAEAARTAEAEADEVTPAKPEFMDVIVSDVRTKNSFGFSVQILNTEGTFWSIVAINANNLTILTGIASLEKLMRDFSLHHRGTTAAPPGFTPKAGDLVSARFSDGAWYRARIRRASPIKKEAEVTFIDYGNQDTIGFDAIRPLDPKFRALPGQAHDARLRCVSSGEAPYRILKGFFKFRKATRRGERILP
jgi:staphylococcal nuclease domain-containing protein 1